MKHKYSWGDSISSAKIVSDKIFVPINSVGEPDYKFMELYIKAIEKLVIKDVVLYADRKIKATKKAINNKQQ